MNDNELIIRIMNMIIDHIFADVNMKGTVNMRNINHQSLKLNPTHFPDIGKHLISVIYSSDIR